MTLTTERIEELAIKIRSFLIENSLWIDVTIYFNGRAFSTDDCKANFFYNDPDNLIILDNIEPKTYFEYVREPNILSMSFECDLYDCFNFQSEDIGLEARVLSWFDDTLKEYGLCYELGNAWNLSCDYL